MFFLLNVVSLCLIVTVEEILKFNLIFLELLYSFPKMKILNIWNFQIISMLVNIANIIYFVNTKMVNDIIIVGLNR